MEKEIKNEMWKQYFRYFRFWFIGVGVLLLVCIFVTVSRSLFSGAVVRGNSEAPEERVYDYADVLTDAEEQKLRDYIADAEEEIKADIVLVTIDQDVEGYGLDWDTEMMNLADDFYDDNNYGYDKPRGNGVLLLDNHYSGQAGSWLSTCGNVYEEFGNHEIDRVLDAVYYKAADGDYYGAYYKYISTTVSLMKQSESSVNMSWLWVVLVPVIAAGFFIVKNLIPKKAEVTTTASTYVTGGKPVMRVCRDDFIRKNVVTRRIESSSGGSHHSSGRGGSHRSSSGTRHGGGGRRR